MSDFPQILFPLLLTTFAGLATGIGGLIVLMSKKPNPRVLSVALGFSAGVMIYVSMIEIFPKARLSLTPDYGEKLAYVLTTLLFFGGIFLIALIDKLVPSFENPHEIHELKDMEKAVDRDKLLRMGLFSALAIGIHNFPEGLATFFSAMDDTGIGLSIALAVAIHNIPEGIAVAIPVLYATNSRRKAFGYSLLSGLSEPVGAVIGVLVLLPVFSPAMLGFSFAMVAGIMVFISLDQLLPTAEKYGEHHLAIYGLISGMAVMATSLVLLS
ncbi:MAG: zinc transporter ZupT [Bacteroidetes bacterium]|nr:zinc transporter ZupT [Bacteroidota bacterium]